MIQIWDANKLNCIKIVKGKFGSYHSTSTISLSEIFITFLIEERNFSRRKAIWVTAAVVGSLAVLCALSFNVLKSVTVFGLNIFDLFNYLSSNVFMLLGGLFTALFVGWFLDRRVIVEQITNRGRLNVPVVNYLMFCLRYVAPVAVVFVFMQLVGII